MQGTACAHLSARKQVRQCRETTAMAVAGTGLVQPPMLMNARVHGRPSLQAGDGAHDGLVHEGAQAQLAMAPLATRPQAAPLTDGQRVVAARTHRHHPRAHGNHLRPFK